jgi:hypothetical protein
MVLHLVLFALRLHFLSTEAPLQILFSSQFSSLIETLDEHCAEAREEDEDEEMLLIYHSVLMSILFAMNEDLEVEVTKDPMVGFLICASIETSGCLKSFVAIATVCSKLVYVMQMIAIKDLLVSWLDHGKGRMVEYAPSIYASTQC